ncbi:MAG: hypothetical protein ACREJO_15525 [Phycisphaerales bacterium]
MRLWPFNKPRPCLHRFGKWLGLVVVVLIVAVDVASVWWGCYFMPAVPSQNNPMIGGELLPGGVDFRWPTPWDPEKLQFTGPVRQYVLSRFRWDFTWDRENYPGVTYTKIFVPLWAPALVIAVPTAWLWWRDRASRRRMLAGQCVKCGYDLAGLGGKPCPECGGIPAHR